MPKPIDEESCSYLCSKQVPMRSDMPGQVQELNSTRVIYWCARTKQCIGPDYMLCNAQACREGRICFESDPEDKEWLDIRHMQG